MSHFKGVQPLVLISFLFAGCASTEHSARTTTPTTDVSYQVHATKQPSAGLSVLAPNATELRQVVALLPAEKETAPDKAEKPKDDEADPKPPKELPPLPRTRPSYAQFEILPIDLPTVLRLVQVDSPAIRFAQAKVREAHARLDDAEVQWIPHLTVGPTYNRFDGQTQNQAGLVFGVSRANLFVGGGPTLSVDLADAIYRPLIEHRLSCVEEWRAKAVGLSAQLEVVGAYLDLVAIHGLLAINTDTLEKAEAMLLAAKNAKTAKLDRSAGDVNRSQTEVLLRKTERLDLEGKAGAASARLAKLLLLKPTVRLVPTEAVLAPVVLIQASATLEHLLELALANRPDLASNREAISAAWARVRKQQVGPYLPRVTLTNQTGVFGGGKNDQLEDFSARNALTLALTWELRNFGLGNRAHKAERQALLDQAHIYLTDAEARALADIVEAAQLAGVKYESLDLAEAAVKEATELYRIGKESTLNVVDTKNLFDALRPLQAIQVLNQARQNYLNAVIEFNRAQYRLFALTGHPPAQADAK